MEFGLLGPVQVTDRSQPLKLGGARQRALLALLLLHANEAVPLDRLVDELWSDSPPRTAAQIVRIYVSQLRKLLEPERVAGAEPEILITHGAGYELRLQPEQLDLNRFERLHDEGRRRLEANDPTALGYLRGALALWRGPPLSDFTFEPFAQGEIARLEDRRLNALQDRIDADLARGAHDDVVPELESLVDRHPLRERLRAQLMLALYRSGRQAEALAAYQAARTFLQDELGIEPGTALKELEGMVLRQDPSLEAPQAPAPQPDSYREDELLREIRKPVTVVSAEISAAVSLDPEARRRLHVRYADALERVFERYEATSEWNDEGVRSLFGTPIAHEDDALRAVRAAWELRSALAEANTGTDTSLDVGLKCRVGIDTGEVLATEWGTSRPAVSGDVIARAGALNRSAGWGEILVGETTWRLVRNTVSLEAAENGHQSTAWRVVSLEDTSDRQRALEAPTIGRERELAEVRHAFERTVEEETSYLFTVLGDPGIGKSRIVREVAATVGADATTLVGRCLSYGEGITFRPLTEMIAQAAGGTAQADILGILGSIPDAEEIAAQLAALTGADVDASGDIAFWAFRRLVDVLAREHPVLLVFEDLHWAEQTLLDLIEHVAARTQRVLLLCNARPELLEKRPAWGGGRTNATTLLLTPLAEEESGALLEALGVPLAEETRGRVIESAEGNPLFVEQLAAMLAETPAHSGDLAVPPTIGAVLASRLDRLGPGELAVLQGAAVIGREFSTASVVELLPDRARQSAGRNLDALLGKGLVRPSSADDSFRFAHVLIQDATYRAISKERRAELHERYADGLAAAAGPRINEEQEVLGYHLEQACRYREDVGLRDEQTAELAARAGTHLGAAGNRATLRGDFPAADNLLSRATRLFSADEQRRLELMPTLGRVLVTTGSLDRAATVLDEACARLAAGDAPALHAHALVERGNLLFWRGGRLEESRHDAEVALAVFSGIGDEQGLAKVWELIARHRRHRGLVQNQSEALERAVTHASRAGDSMREGDARHHTSWSLVDGVAPFDEILRYSKGLEDWAAATGDPLRRLDATGSLTYIRAMQGDYDGAREQHAASTRELEDHGHAIGLYSSAVLSGRVEMLAGNPGLAEEFFRSAHRQMIATGQLAYLPWTIVRLARALLAQGRAEEAGSVLETAHAKVADDGEALQLMRRGSLARARAHQGEIQGALLELQELEQIAGRTDYLLRIPKARLDGADVFAVASRPTEARHHAEEALRLFEFKGDLASGGMARKLLAGLR